MSRKPIGVSILTNGERLPFLERCIHSLLANCYYRPLTICVFNNGSTDGTNEWCMKEMRGGYAIEWLYDCSEHDVGCAAGQNRVAGMLRDYEYVLHLESDFEHLPESLTGEDKLWLHRAVEWMDRGDCDYLYLRRMVDQKEASMHWWSQWMAVTDETTSSGPYLQCPGFWWSNNPHLRRNDSVYEAGCLPMDESKDGPKGTPGWSKPEMETARPSKTWLHHWGLFVHERDSHGDLESLTGCDTPAAFGTAKCKYGFFKDGKDMWCQACNKSVTYKDLPEHEKRFRELW